MSFRYCAREHNDNPPISWARGLGPLQLAVATSALVALSCSLYLAFAGTIDKDWPLVLSSSAAAVGLAMATLFDAGGRWRALVYPLG